jgi:hypothetical protein
VNERWTSGNWVPCNFGKSSYYSIFEILTQQLKRLNTIDMNKHLPFFSWNFFAYWSHDSCAMPLDFDLLFVKKLKDYERLGYLNNTLLIINGDHGQRLSSYYKHTEEAKIERKHPFISIRLPNRLVNTPIHRQLYNNRKKLVTSFDIYQTLKQFLYINKYPTETTFDNDKCRSNFRQNSQKIRSKRGISLFENIPMNRSCLDALINEDECNCQIRTESLTNEQFQLDTGYSIELMNNYLVDLLRSKSSKHRNKCALYQFDRIDYIKKKFINNNKIVYDFAIIVQPYDSKFLFKLKLLKPSKETKSKINLSTEPKIERLSRYDQTAECIKQEKNSAELIFFCYCI